ncbi:hypothetical protein [Kitasatospora sp. NPDC057015]|uniref:hypothetical protein n=1 Tax=Kitasatospora sp. NPDC057015 TaxID=3346001 RepID=UPI003627104C
MAAALLSAVAELDVTVISPEYRAVIVAPDPTRDLRVALKGLQGAYAALAPATYSAAREANPQAAEALLAQMKRTAAGILRQGRPGSKHHLMGAEAGEAQSTTGSRTLRSDRLAGFTSAVIS